MKTSALLLSIAALSSSIATAQTVILVDPATPASSGASASGTMSPVAGLEPRTENGITYVCGGIGSDEAASMKKAASKYDMMLSFAASNGAYLADVEVAIADPSGQVVLATTCDGPMMLVDLPKDGRYRIAAQAGGSTLTRTASISERGSVKRVRMAWPTSTVDMGLTPTMNARAASGMTSGGGTEGSANYKPGYESGKK